MSVEGVSEQCNQLQEEDTTDEDGEYRIRGLHPKCLYRLVLKTPNGQFLQSYPAHYDIKVCFQLNEMECCLYYHKLQPYY